MPASSLSAIPALSAGAMSSMQWESSPTFAAMCCGSASGSIMTMMAVRPKAVTAAILNDVGPAIAPEGIARILGYAGKAVEIGDWNDAADYVRQTNAVAFPHFNDEDWHRFARRTFRQGSDGPELDYDPAIKGVISKPPSRIVLWLTRQLFKRLARKRPSLLVRGMAGTDETLANGVIHRVDGVLMPGKKA